ncbi:peptidase S8 and S53 subtilisin kexin sedolisin (plasmid) [Alkalihalophilus pseudofirmus OF4]|uniref:Peptidase S8 and S53 subtilisin kexin sedolisin n=1 Tax=Alkalihalophilus pseudofirmus (strain ATCC BAA-2126 / JCM 17055 / OF4) TaxID=398511 RepID=D3G210_ALKPO|nr:MULTISPECIES: S8 family peptidase [Alkalihalophilus]ADC52386.1 peptidase S8 and S53 subtilisin kexin sedolisin [Alkalihalophilus pseudofirmus OF4]MED1603437.1 S8 family peptidase [Alkalihalophilus marmarensis]
MKIIISVLLSLLFIGLISWFYNGYEETPAISNIETDGQIYPWGLKAIGVNDSINSLPKKTIKVAVLDSGIYREHEDLTGKVVAEFNAINPGEPVVDDFGHGTAIAGIIAANDNNIGIVGVTPNVELYDVKVLDETGRGDAENLVSAIEWCISQEVDVINVSFGYQSESLVLKRAINNALGSGIIIVAASGNTYGMGVDFPAKYEDVFSITAVDQNLVRVNSSAKGKIDFAAPGIDILSTDREGGYSQFEGTSFATAYASGFIARILQHYSKELSHEEIKDLLIENTVELDGGNAPSIEYGYGLLKLNN